MKNLVGVRNWLSCERRLVFLLLLSLGIKAIILLSGGPINVDGVRYISAAREFAAGNFAEGLRIERMPFYPGLIVAFRLLVRDWVLSAQLISLGAMVLTIVPLYRMTRDLFDEKAAFWAGLAFALSPVLNGLAVEVIRDPLFLLFVAWAVYFFLQGVKANGSIFFLLASASSIFAVLCRMEGIVLFPLFFSMLLVLAIRNTPDRRLFLKGMAVIFGLPLGLGFLTSGCLLLWADRGFFTVSRFGEPLAYFQSFLNGDFLDMYQHIYEHFKAYKNPRYPWDYGSFANTARHYLPLIYLISVTEAVAKNLFPFFVVPFLAGFLKRPTLLRGHWLILLGTGAYLLVGYYFLFTHDFLAKRYVLVPALLIFPWVGLGLDKIWSVVSNSNWSKTCVFFFLLVFCAAPSFKSLEALTGAERSDILRDAGQWLSGQPQFRDAVVACSDPRVRFYASENLKFLPETENAHVGRDFKKMEITAIKNNADLLVMEISKKKREKVPKFENFQLFKQFSGNINDVLVFRKKR